MQVTADDIAQLLASEPPRKVPKHLLRSARWHRVQWGTTLFGLVFGIFSLPFLKTVFPWRALDEWHLSQAAPAVGEVTQVTDERLSMFGEQVMKYDFLFTYDSGVVQKGMCYAAKGRWSEGDRVSVRYNKQKPQLACIEGARLSPGGWSGVLVLIFPAVGFGMVGWGAYQWAQAGRLLQRGLVAEVDVVSVERTSMHVNKRPVYEIVLSASHLPLGGNVAIKRVNPEDIDLAESRLKAKQPIFVLYSPQRPRKLLFPETLIGN